MIYSRNTASGAIVKVSSATLRSRISRSLVTAIALSLIQTVVPAVIGPTIVTPKAEAVTVNYANATSGTDVLVPTGVYSVRLTARGGAGGTGGNDGTALGLAGGNVGYTEATFAVKPGDRITMYPGGAGGAGSTQATGNGGGAAGAAAINTNTNIRTASYKFNGTFSDQLTVTGGVGGAAGGGGSSGGGGGGGAATIIAINENVALVAGGGGGGAGGSGAAAQPWSGALSFGTIANGADGVNGGTCGSTDGGGSGAGGGGWKGGVAGAVTRPAGGECRGFSGSAGSNFLWSAASSTMDTTVSPNGAGSVTYDFVYDSIAACATETQTVDIYTVVKVTKTSTCTWSVPATVSVIDLFLVGGGGGGAGDAGGGGGGGAALSRTAIAVTPNSNLTLKVGYGGSGSGWQYSSDGFIGDSTTVQTPSGNLYHALGGRSATNAPASNGGLGGVATSGGFSGGAGGKGGACAVANSAPNGNPGSTGISNYYYGTINSYGGGGGGGSCPNGLTNSPAAGIHGGGAGGYASSVSINEMGGNALDNSGSGGGGGTASGPGQKLPGGKGGSGVILIRYATNSLDSFPASLATAVSARYSPNDLQVLDSTRKGWIDSSGNTATIANAAFTGSPYVDTRGTTDGANSTGSSKTIRVAKGGTGDKVNLYTLPTNYTMFHLVRYVTGQTTGRIISATAGNNLSGHHSGTYKCAHHETWLTGSGCSGTNIYRWLLSTDQLRYYRADGADVTLAPNDSTYLTNQALSGGVMGINNFWNNQPSGWEVADIVIFNRRLSHSEIILMENWIARVNGLTIDRPLPNSETDTAGVFSGQFYKGFYKNDFVINDTFTVESWVKPAPSCATGICSIFSSENVLVTKIDSGVFQFALDGTTDRWAWVNTGVKVPSNEWHHIAMTKRLIGNQANSIEIYLNGQLAYTHAGNPYTGSATASGSTTDVVRPPTDYYYIGARTDTTRYSGAIDEFKFWSVARTGAEIAGDMHSNETSSPNLSLYYDFNSNTLANSLDLQNLAQFGPGRSYMQAVTNMVFEDVKVVTTTGPYTTITFPRTYITQQSGWKVPVGIETATTLVVGGGGGGGFGGSTNAPAGGGGGGGVTVSLTQKFTPGATVTVKVGAGGLGGFNTSAADVRNGQSSSIGVGATLTALGGGGGGNLNLGAGAGGSTVATGGGSGGGGSNACTGSPLTPSGTITPGATVPSGNNGSGGVWGWGGSGGGARGAALNGVCTSVNAGTPGPGFFDPVTNIEYGRGGSADSFSTTNAVAGNRNQNNGWGGIVSYNGGNSNGNGYRGSTGTVIIRYITANKPTYTKPTNAYLNVGMTETFTTNVAQDSLTAMLTRTFKWESTTAGAGGTFTTIKQGTGAANAVFSWIPTDTSTSGSQFLYRLTVTDSDTAGLIISDSSTAFAVINKTLQMTGITSIKKAINVARNDTFTVIDGTSTYRYTLSPTIPGVTLDTSTVGSPVIRISDTATIGTFLETLTVTDSVSASVAIALSITISPPPTLVNASPVIETGQVFSIDASNSASFNKTTGAWNDTSGSKRPITVNSSTGSPQFSDDNAGVVKFDRTKYQALYTNGIGRLTNWTIDTWVRIDEESGTQRCVVTAEWVPSVGFNYTLCIDTSRTIFTGFYIPNSWTYMRTTQVVPLNTWVHLVGTWNGTKVKLYINGVLASGTEIYESAGLVAPGTATQSTYISKWYDSGIQADAAYYSPLSIGSVRLYNLALTETQTAQNYNATKYRFDLSNRTILKPSQKYGSLNVETFTVNSGGDTKTVTFAVGNRTGIAWDTSSTPGQVKLSVQESLTPGTYYDTITVTDNFAQSTTLPITFTVSKADTITVTAGPAISQVFNNQHAASLPAFGITGLVSSDTGTVARKFVGIDWTKPCAQGGGCEVGDTGPGGGTIFYISPTAINSSSTISTGGRYLEAAPLNWSGLSVESTTAWARATTSVTGTLSSIGAGAENTRLINNALTTNSVAAKVAADLTYGGKSDWFLPSTLELKEMYEALYLPSLAGNLGTNNYWTSTQSTTATQADSFGFGSGGTVIPTTKTSTNVLRPIRAYSPDTITVTTVPTNVDSYTVIADTPTMTVGSLDNYQAVVYQRSGLDITQARQDPLRFNTFGATLGLPFRISILGGSGSGAVTESLTAGSTATGCAISGDTITSTSAGACNLQIKKAYSRNYLAETITATVYFLLWVINQPSPAPGSGPNIALSGESDVTVDLDLAPMISSLSTYAATAGVTVIQVNGVGFNGSDPLFEIKFWRDKAGTGFTINPAKTQITVTVPAGTRSGKVSVITSKGLAVSEFPLTITP
jgi:hypothetical protein